MLALERRVHNALLAMFVALLVAIAIAFAFTRHMASTVDWVDHTYAVMVQVDSSRAQAARAQFDMRLYKVTADPTQLDSANAKIADLVPRIDQLRAMTVDNPVQQAHVRTLLTALAAWRAILAGTAPAPQHGLVDPHNIILGVFDAMRAEEQQLLDQRQSEERHTRYIVNALYVALLLLTLITSQVAYAQIRRHIREWRSTQRQLEGLNTDLDHKTRLLEETVREIESFSYSVSHDLRAPIRHISGYAQMLLEDAPAELTADSVRHLHVIADSARRMGLLIDDLLAFSRLGRKPLDHQPVDMQELVDSAVEKLCDDSATQRGGSPRARPIVATLPACSGDRSLLLQVWINLLSNAIKYSAPRGADARIEVFAETGSEGVRYLVRDNGVGFDMNYVGKLFGVFQRLHSDDQFEGTGVGLAIVQRIITRHGGHVDAIGELDRGATFSFVLPNPEIAA